MTEHTQEAMRSALEDRSRALFHESVDGLDLRVRSRLTQARHAALDAAAAASRRPWFFRMPLWTPAAGVAAAALLGAALWLGLPGGHGGHGITADNQSSLEDLDIVASSDEGSGDAIEMLQNDLDFYDFADKATNSGPAA
ncbi:MAG TPA: hypothetical protein VGL34_17800 [Steroidobacteraceae bacterium]